MLNASVISCSIQCRHSVFLPPRSAPVPSRVEFQLAASRPAPTAGDGWLYELKHDAHRLVVLSDVRGGLRLLSRNGHERTRLFGPAFTGLANLAAPSSSTAKSPRRI